MVNAKIVVLTAVELGHVFTSVKSDTAKLVAVVASVSTEKENRVVKNAEDMSYVSPNGVK